jgi:hypothetical protein
VVARQADSGDLTLTDRAREGRGEACGEDCAAGEQSWADQRPATPDTAKRVANDRLEFGLGDGQRSLKGLSSP